MFINPTKSVIRSKKCKKIFADILDGGRLQRVSLKERRFLNTTENGCKQSC